MILVISFVIALRVKAIAIRLEAIATLALASLAINGCCRTDAASMLRHTRAFALLAGFQMGCCYY